MSIKQWKLSMDALLKDRISEMGPAGIIKMLVKWEGLWKPIYTELKKIRVSEYIGKTDGVFSYSIVTR